jgi:2-C-methyl-D-erythritol 2,4-cyclodiphosphate synthase
MKKCSCDFRIGIGQDSHEFSKKKEPLILCGYKISSINGFSNINAFAGNGDGDIFLHSLCNALSSAIGGDSLGTWADEMYYKYKIKDSKKMLDVVFQKIIKAGFIVNNVSFSAEGKKPFLTQKITDKMKGSVAKLLNIKKDRVGITLTSGETLSSFGKGQGMQVFTVVSLIKK